MSERTNTTYRIDKIADLCKIPEDQLKNCLELLEYAVPVWRFASRFGRTRINSIMCIDFTAADDSKLNFVFKDKDSESPSDTLAEPPTEILPCNAVPGKFYDSDAWGRVLCCLMASEEWRSLFALKTLAGNAELVRLNDDPLTLAPEQSW